MPKLSDEELTRRLAAKFNIDLSTVQVISKGESTNASQEAEAVAAFVDNPKRFSKRLCRRCGEEFATDYGSVAFCSDNCRRAHLESIGILWSPDKTPADRWGYRFPLVVGPEALKMLREALAPQGVAM